MTQATVWQDGDSPGVAASSGTRIDSLPVLGLVHPTIDINEDHIMRNVTAKIRTFLRDEEGLTMVEYGVAGTLITLAALAAFTALGVNVGARIQAIADIMQ